MKTLKIIIFTGYSSLRNLRQGVVRDAKGINLIKTYPVIGYDKSEGQFVSTFAGKNIILVQDHADPANKDVIALSEEANKGDILILKHRRPGEELLRLFKQPYIKTGEHSDSGSHYKDVFDIILDNNDEKYERIKKSVFTDADTVLSIEKKLLLLHDCLHPATAAKADIAFLTDEQRAIVQYLAKNKNNFDKDYIDKLTQLRISLLGS